MAYETWKLDMEILDKSHVKSTEVPSMKCFFINHIQNIWPESLGKLYIIGFGFCKIHYEINQSASRMCDNVFNVLIFIREYFKNLKDQTLKNNFAAIDNKYF